MMNNSQAGVSSSHPRTRSQPPNPPRTVVLIPVSVRLQLEQETWCSVDGRETQQACPQTNPKPERTAHLRVTRD